MSDRVKILCDHCSHNEVCIYKQDYLDILEVVKNASITKNAPDGKIALKKVIHYDFVGDISVGCKYYRKMEAIFSR